MKKERRKLMGSGRKRRLMAAGAMLLVSAIMLATVSYAWLVLSTSPEVTGITTNIGANGSLEIALLNTQTRADLSQISTNVGDSAERQGTLAANVTWGNLVDLGQESYGLDKIVMLPSQLLLEGTAISGYSVRTSSPLALPLYGTDGRITELSQNTVSAVYSGGFNLTEEQTFGVRGIGLVDSSSAEETAVSYAKSNISAFSGSAKNAAITAINNNGSSLMGIVFMQQMSSNPSFGDGELDALKTTVNGLQGALNYVELALRYGILAKVALAGTGDFAEAQSLILNQENPLSNVYDAYSGFCPAEMATWVSQLEADRNTLNNAYSECVALAGTAYSAADINPILARLLDSDHVYVDGASMNELDVNELMGKSSMTLSLLPGSGVLADIADFVGNYSTWVTYAPYQIEFSVRTAETTSYLAALSASIGGVEISSSGTVITSLGGYAIDLAFRCNAMGSNEDGSTDLQLQTVPEQRVYSDSVAGDLQGGGSYMQFSTKDSTFSTGRMVELMDAVRVTFIDIQGNILAMAKLNTSNRQVQEDGSIKANLYLYDYTVEPDRTISMGSRRSGDMRITTLDQNIAKAVTVVVWLDGNIVDNTKVSAVADTSLSGVLNLQFSSSADLIPAGNNALYNANASRKTLTEIIESVKGVYIFGKGYTYTDVSWNAFAAAYEYAVLVSEDSGASSAQIKAAYNNLNKTYDELAPISKETLSAQIAEVRAVVGQTGTVVGYAQDGIIYTTFTEAQADSSTAIYQADYDNNLHDEGNGIQTPIYSRLSWDRLVDALYQAEAVCANGYATDAEINAAITDLERGLFALDRCVFYEAYDYNGEIYYLAITDVEDTYGKWYDADFHRVISDLTILNLDTGATKATVAKIESRDYYEQNGSTVNPSLNLNSNAYGSFKNDEIQGVRWGMTGIVISDINGDTTITLDSLIFAADEILQKADNSHVDLTNEDALQRYRDSALAAVSNAGSFTNSEITTLLSNLSNEIAEAAIQVNEKIESDANDELLRNLTVAAVAEAKGLEAYSDEEKSLKEITDTAEEDLEAFDNAIAGYGTALTDLNAKIAEAGGTERRTIAAAIVEAARLAAYAEPAADADGQTIQIHNALVAAVTAAEEAANALTENRSSLEGTLEALNAAISANGGTAQSQATILKAGASELEILAAAIEEAERLDSYWTTLEEQHAQGETTDWDDEIDWEEVPIFQAALLEAVEEAAAVQEKGEEASLAEFAAVLDNLNAAITTAHGTPQTAYNVILHSSSYSTGSYEPTNRVVLPSAILRLGDLTTDDIGDAVLTARILTKNGVVYTAQKTINFFNKAAGIRLYQLGDSLTAEELLEYAIAEAKTLDAYHAMIEIDGEESTHSPLYEKVEEIAEAFADRDEAMIGLSSQLNELNVAISQAGGKPKSNPEEAIQEAGAILPRMLAAKETAADEAENARTVLNEAIEVAGGTAQETLAAAINEANDCLAELQIAVHTAETNAEDALAALNRAIVEAYGSAKSDLAEAIMEAQSLPDYSRTTVEGEGDDAVVVHSDLYERVVEAQEAKDNYDAAQSRHEALYEPVPAARDAYDSMTSANNAYLQAQGRQEELTDCVAALNEEMGAYTEAHNVLAGLLPELNALIEEAGGLVKTAETVAPHHSTVSVLGGETFTYDLLMKTTFVDAEAADGTTARIKMELPYNETPKNYYWAVSNPSTVTLKTTKDGKCTVTVNERGQSVTLNLTVVMNTGSEYTAYITLNT